MRFWGTIFFILLVINYSSAQNIDCKNQGFIVKNIIKDFGAKADGITNDQAAFKAAADFFNKRVGCGKLIIPYGLYKVGRQEIDTPKSFMKGVDVLQIVGVSNFIIEGIPNKTGQYPVLKFDNGLYFGSFYADKEKFRVPKCKPGKQNFDLKVAAAIGAGISINYSTGVKIKNIELDGNMDNFIMGGAWGDIDRQLFHVGIFTNQGRDIELSNINVHHFALDGLENAGANKLRFENVTSSYNARQGFSWVDGDSLVAINCKFTHTGRVKIHSAPGAGIDIEPERKRDISYARFTNCEIGYNRGCGLLMAVAANTVRDMRFDSCTFIGMYNWSAWVPGIDIHFTDCKFYGNVVHTVPNAQVKTVKDITSFKRCYFSDIYNGVITKKPGGYFFPLNNEKIILDSCVVKIYNRGFLWHSSGCGPTDSLTSEVKNTTFYAANENEWQVAITGIKITNSKLFAVPGKRAWACPKDYTNFERTDLTKEKIKLIFPEMNNVIPVADSVKYFSCAEETKTISLNNKLSRRVAPKPIGLLLSDTNCVITNHSSLAIEGVLNIYDQSGKLAFTKSKLKINKNYTKSIVVFLKPGKYQIKFLQRKKLIASNTFIIL